jgi:hypothetical protein
MQLPRRKRSPPVTNQPNAVMTVATTVIELPDDGSIQHRFAVNETFSLASRQRIAGNSKKTRTSLGA